MFYTSNFARILPEWLFCLSCAWPWPWLQPSFELPLCRHPACFYRLFVMKSSLFLLTLIVRWTVRQTTGAERLHKCKEWTPITPRTYGTRLQIFTSFSSNLGQRLVHFVIREVFRSCFQKSLQEVPWNWYLNYETVAAVQLTRLWE